MNWNEPFTGGRFDPLVGATHCRLGGDAEAMDTIDFLNVRSIHLAYFIQSHPRMDSDERYPKSGIARVHGARLIVSAITVEAS